VSTTPNASSAYEPDNAIARLVLKDPAIVSNAHESDDALVLAVRSQLLVHQSVTKDVGLRGKLSEIARPVATISAAGSSRATDAAYERHEIAAALPSEVEVWHLHNPDTSPHEAARSFRNVTGTVKLKHPDGRSYEVQPVTPNHVAIVAGSRGSGCPAGPPRQAGSPRRPFIEPYKGGSGPHVAVLDTGYIYDDPRHERLDERVTPVLGEWLDTSVDPPVWRSNQEDAITTDADGRLIGIVGHGTFIAGLIAHVCPQAAITSVGHRDSEIPVGNGADQHRLWASELSLANSLWKYRDADVIQCGFAFPTLDDQPPLLFANAVHDVKAAHPGIAVVSPAGNEQSPRRYWPAALPDVIGVAATKHDGRHRASFSNWGPWADCCAIGEDVRSTYIHWEGPVEDENPDEVEDFEGWARWQGTSFAAPKVSAAIAREVAEHPEWTPAEAFDKLVAGETNVQVRQVSNDLYPGGCTLPELCIH
jgi:subtilisin family serine protease